MKASYSNKGIILNQEKFTQELISESCFTDFRKVLTSLPTNLKLQPLTQPVSITGYLFLLEQSPVNWKSTKQSTISKSNSEAEYRAMASASAEVTWIVRLNDFGIPNLQPITLFYNNSES